jgi:arabinan endo-1,5-alpha-L-arabinosidase
MGIPLLKGGGKLVVAARDRGIGPGHFGLIDLGDGMQKFSMHYEADLDRSARSVLAIQPLLWKDGWPIAGDNIKPGTYEIQSERSGAALELAVDFVRMNVDRRGGFFGPPTGPVSPVAMQTLAQDSAAWPKDGIDVDLADYMIRPHQQWAVTPVPDAGGYFDSPYFKILIAGTERALAATADGRVVTVPVFNGADDQLWRIDQLTDGTYRITPKAGSKRAESLALVAIGASTPALVKFDPASDAGRWTFRALNSER